MLNYRLDILEAAERAQIPVNFLTDTKTPDHFFCWYAPHRDRNDISPLCWVKLANDKSILLTGDMGADAEEWYVAHLSPFPTADYLKIAHHGSKFSSSPLFLTATQAKTALISVGRKNRYGHPNPDALQRIEDAGMKITRTDLEGTRNFY